MTVDVRIGADVEKSTDADKKIDAIANEPDLDSLISEIGEFGWKQIFHFILLVLPITLSSTLLLNFFFTAATLDYRCVYCAKRCSY